MTDWLTDWLTLFLRIASYCSTNEFSESRLCRVVLLGVRVASASPWCKSSDGGGTGAGTGTERGTRGRGLGRGRERGVPRHNPTSSRYYRHRTKSTKYCHSKVHMWLTIWLPYFISYRLWDNRTFHRVWPWHLIARGRFRRLKIAKYYIT